MSRRNAEQFKQDMLTLLPEVASKYNGEALFAPQASVYANALGVGPSAVYHSGSYEEKLITITGLVVVHNGVVLGSPENLTPPEVIPERLEELASQLESLTEIDRRRILARLSIKGSA